MDFSVYINRPELAQYHTAFDNTVHTVSSSWFPGRWAAALLLAHVDSEAWLDTPGNTKTHLRNGAGGGV